MIMAKLAIHQVKVKAAKKNSTTYGALSVF